MLTENQKKWVAALRSGKYKQGRYFLNSEGKFCCLGVACEVAIENGVELTKETVLDSDNVACIAYNGEYQYLPTPVIQWLGLSYNSRHINAGSYLVLLNDSSTTFDKIAELIESEPEDLFS